MKATTGLLMLALAGALMLHLSLGAQSIGFGQIWRAILAFDPAEPGQVVVRALRLPRALAAAGAGATLAAAGCLLQALTRNPLAEPGTLGLLAGAASAVVIGIGWLNLAGGAWVPGFAAMGVALAMALVGAVTLAAAPAIRPMALVLAGAGVSALLGALDGLVLLLNEEALRMLRPWLVGSLSAARWPVVLAAAPWAGLGLILALAMAPALTALSLGDEVARGLGQRLGRQKALILLAVVLCTAAAVALAGVMGFVGLVVPHALRLVCGGDYRRLVPLSVLAGAVYLPLVDVAARLVLAPAEVATGLMTALLGAPLFLWLVRSRA